MVDVNNTLLNKFGYDMEWNDYKGKIFGVGGYSDKAIHGRKYGELQDG